VTAIELAARVRAGDVRALARAISHIENDTALAGPLIAALHPHSGHAWLVGLTGPPGAGKSTLVHGLTGEWRRRGWRVGVLAVDPTSPFTGGALLGDRVRMQAHAVDGGVFIRSLATRGHLGGVSRATGDVAMVLDAAGYDLVVIETVGVGQDEIEIVRTADLAIVVMVPGLGDDVQALKAGVMEIADIFVVNKADREGADRAVASLETLLSLQALEPGAWRPPVLRTEATTGSGIAALADAVEHCRSTRAPERASRRRARTGVRVRDLVSRLLLAHLQHQVLTGGELDALIDRVEAREMDPHAAAALIADRLLHRA
jgi:LAO/AO transport system kinase